jgi:hypothetical protein
MVPRAEDARHLGVLELVELVQLVALMVLQAIAELDEDHSWVVELGAEPVTTGVETDMVEVTGRKLYRKILVGSKSVMENSMRQTMATRLSILVVMISIMRAMVISTHQDLINRHNPRNTPMIDSLLPWKHYQNLPGNSSQPTTFHSLKSCDI